MEAEDILKAAELAAKSARRWAGLAMMVAFVFVVLTVIDNGIKRDVLKSVSEARDTLDSFKATVREAVSGSSAGQAPAGNRGGDQSGNGVVHAAGVAAEDGGHAGSGSAARGSRPRSTPRRASGDE